MKKILFTLTAAASLLLLAACTGSSTTDPSSSNSAESTSNSESVDLNALELPQLSTDVQENEALVEMVTEEGSIKIKLFPEIAPKAVENFLTHAKDGYYDGLTFHRVVEEFMIQGATLMVMGLAEKAFGVKDSAKNTRTSFITCEAHWQWQNQVRQTAKAVNSTSFKMIKMYPTV